MPPYTTRSSGRSATSASRLFCSIRYGASVNQDRQLSSVPRGARMVREGSWRLDIDAGPWSERGADYRRGGKPTPGHDNARAGRALRGAGRTAKRSADRRIQPAQRVGDVGGAGAVQVLAAVHAAIGSHAVVAVQFVDGFSLRFSGAAVAGRDDATAGVTHAVAAGVSFDSGL